MRKAYLCHSSHDKEYVRIVANGLGRAKAVFDEISFLPGQDFHTEILDKLDKTALFVFFVSQNSLKSGWCRFELDEAWLRRLMGGIEGQLAIIMDRTTTYGDLPPWLQRAKAVIQTRPSQATRDIQHALLSLVSPEERRPFVGRQPLLSQFSRAVSQIEGRAPRLFILAGLDGIGRRSYLRRACADNLGIHLGPVVLVDNTRRLDDIYMWALEETADIGTRSALAHEYASFQQLPDAKKVDEILSRLRIMCADRCVPCFVDLGGLLDDDAKYPAPFIDLLQKFTDGHDDHYLALVHRRTPMYRDLPFSDAILFQKVTPLEQHECRLLLQQLLRREEVPTPGYAVEEIAEYLDGYPPAAYFSASWAKQYGLANLNADKSTLADFKARRFARLLSNLELAEDDWRLLQYLAMEQLVPIHALAIGFARPQEDIAGTLRTLIDHSLVVVVNDSYAVSAPLRDAIIRAKGFLSPEQYAEIAHRLTDAFWSDPNAAPTVDIIDATLHAVARGGSTDLAPYSDLVRVSAVHRLAEESYHTKDWEKALEYAKRAETMDPQSPKLRAIHFKSLVQLERWKDAEDKLQEVQAKGDRGALYLKGFMLRRRRRYPEAIHAFEAAMQVGDTSISVYRDYADCLYRTKRFDEALANIRFALKRDSENVYVLDLSARICIDGSFWDEAEKLLTDLERCDREGQFIHHRRSRFFAAHNQWVKALQEAEKACDSGYAPIEAYSQRASAMIELGQFEEARKAVESIRQKFGKQRWDVQSGLQCKLFIRQGLWQQAKAIWDRLEDKTTVIAQVILLQINDLKSADAVVPLGEREQARRDAETLQSSIGGSSLGSELIDASGPDATSDGDVPATS